MKQLRFIGPAREEFLAEVVYYHRIQAELSLRFVAAIEDAAARALAFPSAGTPVIRGTRRVTVKTFPFSLIYLPTMDGIVIIAVAHQSKRPGYWRGRRQDE